MACNGTFVDETEFIQKAWESEP